MRTIRRPVLLVDTDEVLGDFQTPALKVMEKVTGIRRGPDDFKTWDIFDGLSDEQRRSVFEELQKPGFCSSLKPTPGSIDAVAELRNIVDLHIVTSPFFGAHTWVHERYEWLRDLFGFTYDDVTHTRAKHYVYGDGLLDDRPANVVRWAEYHPGGDAMLWHIPNTEGLPYDHLRVRSWEEVIERAKKLGGRDNSCARCDTGAQTGKGTTSK